MTTGGCVAIPGEFYLVLYYFFFYPHDVGSKLEGHTFDPSEVDS